MNTIDVLKELHSDVIARRYNNFERRDDWAVALDDAITKLGLIARTNERDNLKVALATCQNERREALNEVERCWDAAKADNLSLLADRILTKRSAFITAIMLAERGKESANE